MEMCVQEEAHMKMIQSIISSLPTWTIITSQLGRL